MRTEAQVSSPVKNAVSPPADLDPVVLAKLRCPGCGGGKMLRDAGPDRLRCTDCRAEYPVREGRFPDFLSSAERAELEHEVAFWHEHHGNTVYQGGSDVTYRDWRELMGVDPRAEAIELGCGSGALLSLLDVKLRVGLEPAQGLLSATKGFSGIIGTATHLPFADETFDVVYFMHSLHHVVDKPRGFAEAVRITRPGGRLIVMEPNAQHPQRRLISNPKSVLRKFKPLVRFIGPVETFQSVDELVALGKIHGLAAEKVQYIESRYDRMNVRRLLQRIYAVTLGPIVPEKYLLPNYFVSFRKAR